MKALFRSCMTTLLLLHVVSLAVPLRAAEVSLGRLDAQVQAEEAIRAVKRLQNAYAQYRSEGMWNEVMELFADDVTASFATIPIPLNGKSELLWYFLLRAERLEARPGGARIVEAGADTPGLREGQLHTYLNYQPIVNISADGQIVRATWHELALRGQFGEAATWDGGIYENEYRRDGGVWKISKMFFYPQYWGNYDDYGHQSFPAWLVPYHFDAAHVGLTIPDAALAAFAPATGIAGERAAQLDARIERLHDESAVQNLQHSFGYYLDRKMYADVADLFADTGSIEIGRSGVHLGRQHITRLLEMLYGRAPLQNGELFDHINLGSVVTIAPDGLTAASRTSQLSQVGRNGQFARWELGIYENSYVKQDGTWKLSALRYFPRMSTDYDLGWQNNAQAITATRMTAWDRAPTHRYESYPSAHVVGFHYAHPVSGEPAQYPDTYVAPIPTVAQPQVPARAARADQPADLAQLARRLDAAIAVDAVENLMSSYGYYIDESAWNDMAATFASKGSKEITGVGVYIGPERIREILNRRGPRNGRSPDFFTIHQLVQPVIHISEDGTYANARMRLFQSGGNADGSSGSWIGGIYENTAYVENGEWKFGRQDLHHLFNASYRNGWARIGPSAAPVADANSPASGPAGRAFRGGGITQGLGGAAAPNQFAADYPPDAPIRAKQYAFPEITTTAFHYKNPVSGREPPELLP